MNDRQKLETQQAINHIRHTAAVVTAPDVLDYEAVVRLQVKDQMTPSFWQERAAGMPNPGNWVATSHELDAKLHAAINTYIGPQAVAAWEQEHLDTSTYGRWFL